MVNGMSSLYLVCNRGKRSIAVDLHDEDGVDIVRRLAAESDVFIENFRPGVMDKLGLGYDALAALNPISSTCHFRVSAATGPYRDRSVYDTVMQAYGGFAANQADPNDHVPVFLRQTAADKVTALYAAQAISGRAVRAGARRRRPTRGAVHDGRGDLVPLGRLRGQRGACSTQIDSQNSSFVAGFRPMRFSDGWGIMTPTSDHDFAGMCKALDVDGYDDPRVATIGERVQHRHLSEAIVRHVLRDGSNLTIEQTCDGSMPSECPCSMILAPAELATTSTRRGRTLRRARPPCRGPHPPSPSSRPVQCDHSEAERRVTRAGRAHRRGPG